VPARRGQRILYTDTAGQGMLGTITGGSGAHLIVQFDNPAAQRRQRLHPTWQVQYLERMWRCTACGKWSHAVRRPKYHRVTVVDEPAEGTALEYLAASLDPDDQDAWVVPCGPFVRYEARRAE
jgi:hypothetical protein